MEFSVLWESKAGQVKRNSANLVSMTQMRSALYLGLRIERLRIFTPPKKQALGNILSNKQHFVWESFGFVLMVQEEGGKHLCRTGVEWNSRCRSWEQL